MKFLILTSVLNGADYLGETIASVRAQTHRDWRHVIIDAGSTDATAEIAGEAAARDSRIELRSNPGGGLYETLIDGFADRRPDETAMAWLNHDDLYPPWAFAEAARVMGEGHDWVSGLPGCWDGQGRLRAVMPVGWRPRKWIAGGWFHNDFLGCIQQESLFFSARLWDRLPASGLADVGKMRLAGDFLLWRMMAEHAPLHPHPTVLGGFRIHAANQSKLRAQQYREEVRAHGGVFPPRWIARRGRSLYDAAAAMAHVRRGREAMLALHGETPPPETPASRPVE